MLPDANNVARAFEETEFTVVVDPFLTDTGRRADLVLPVPTLLEDTDLLGAYGHHYLSESRPVVPPPEGVLHEAELIQGRELEKRLEPLGPDVLSHDFDPHLTAARLLAAGGRPMCDVLLDQRVLAGLGHVFKSELLFLARVHPARLASTVDRATAELICERAGELLRVNVQDGASDGIVTYHGMRRTTGRSDPGDRMWVYGRGGRPCRECGTAIEMRRMGQHARSTYYCPRCQPLTRTVRAFG